MTPYDDLRRDLTQALPVHPAQLSHLRARLGAAADDAGLLDLAYRTIDSPVGPLLVVATVRGVVRIAFAAEGHDRVLESLAVAVSPRILPLPARLDLVARELAEYFDGRRRSFEVTLDRRLSTGFRGTVLAHLSGVAYGETLSYAALAQRAGNPRAVRAVGSACATNPLPIIVACHRVVRSDGGLGGYLGGLETKRELLALESGGGRGASVIL